MPLCQVFANRVTYYVCIKHLGMHQYFICYREWFKKSCLSTKQVCSPDDKTPKLLLELLKKQESILIIASR